MTDSASCSHLRVIYKTAETTDGYTRGWWECSSNCGKQFLPRGTKTHAHGIDPCAYCATGDIAVKTTLPAIREAYDEWLSDCHCNCPECLEFSSIMDRTLPRREKPMKYKEGEK